MLRGTAVLVGGIWLMATLVGCEKSTEEKAPVVTTKAAAPSRREVALRGVSPSSFKCETIASIASMETLFGPGINVQETAFEPPPGVPRQCAFNRAVEDKREMWSFDIDCRDSARKDARDRMAQHTASAGDAGVTTVALGRGALDHHNVALLFIDDDTPCQVRVLGLDAPRREQFARLLLKNLTPDTAPIRLNRTSLRRAAR